MVGRKVLLRVDKAPAQPGEMVLEADRTCSVTDPTGVERVKGISLTIRAGEILGIAGVAGNGQSELLEVLGGMIPASGGQCDAARRGDRPDRAKTATASRAAPAASPMCPRIGRSKG